MVAGRLFLGNDVDEPNTAVTVAGRFWAAAPAIVNTNGVGVGAEKATDAVQTGVAAIRLAANPANMEFAKELCRANAHMLSGPNVLAEVASANKASRPRTSGTQRATGRGRDQARLRELADDPNTSSADRGWIRQDQNEIQRKKRTRICRPPGKELAHSRGREAAKGYDHVDSTSNLHDKKLHKTQHKFDDFGRKNKERTE